MGSIRTKKLKNGTPRYYAEIRINRQGFPAYRESASFSNKKIAQAWIAKREEELKNDPKQLLGNKNIDKNFTVSEAITRYINEQGDNFGRSKKHALQLLQKFPIANIPLTALSPTDITEHAMLRKNGVPSLALDPISPVTIGIELSYLYNVLEHADIMWEAEINISALMRAKKQLKKTRNIARSNTRDRLVRDQELIELTRYFYQKHLKGSPPLHLILWFAIYSGRRQGEIFQLQLNDDLGDCYIVRDVKNPNGSKGNHKKFTVTEQCRKIINLLKPYAQDGLLIPLNQKSIAARFNEAFKYLDIQDLHFHDFRHEACTRLAEAGMTIPQIQSISLHDSWSSLQRYVSIHKRIKTLDFDEVMQIITQNP